MMNKQRFSVVYEKFTSKDIIPKGIMDNKKNNHMCRIEEVCGVLNEQQSTISALKEENEVLLKEWSERQQYFKKVEDEYHERVIEQQATIEKQNELINLIADACIFSKEYSVKEILRKEIEGIDTVAGEFASAWHDYVILSEFFKEHYKEDWYNE